MHHRLSVPSATVDHNILRSINATGDDIGGHKLEIEDDSLVEESRRGSLDSKSGISVSGPVAGSVGAGAAKKPPPTPSERLNLRKQMISFFDGSRDSEIDRVWHSLCLFVNEWLL